MTRLQLSVPKFIRKNETIVKPSRVKTHIHMTKLFSFSIFLFFNSFIPFFFPVTKQIEETTLITHDNILYIYIWSLDSC